MRYALFTFFLLITCGSTFAQENYDASLIPKELLPYASAVIRNKEETVEIKDPEDAVYRFKNVVTILNKNGDDEANIEIYYDKTDNVKNIKGVIYNAFGKQIEKFSEKDFGDNSVADDETLFSSARIKHFSPAINDYPCTVAYEYEIRTRQTLEIKSWQPLSRAGESIEKGVYTFSCKPDLVIRYKATNIPGNVSIGTNNDSKKTYTWQVTNLKAIRDEPYSPYYANFVPSVQISPEKFTYYGINGQFNDWKTLGKWEYDNLIAGRRELPQQTIDKIRELTKDIQDPKLKAKKVFEFMQNKTHYISVQVGIGGNQPFLASEVDQQSYGDCKALVNYTQALLKAVDINSYYCVVQADDDYNISLLSDFASMEQGNHIILCLPFKNDTTWADCTSQTIPFGYLGSFTDDRNVLACTPEGGKLLHTPKYTADQNLKARTANFLVGADGAITGTISTKFEGIDYSLRDELVDESSKEQNKILQKIYPINNMEIGHYELKQDKSFNPSTTENIKLSARDYASFTGGKYYFMLNPVNRIEETPKEVMNRQNDVYINRGYTDIDEITYTIPAGYHLEKEPLNITIDKPFGKFSATMELKGSRLTYKRKFQLIDGTYGKDTYQDLVDFFQDVVDADDYTVSLVKN